MVAIWLKLSKIKSKTSLYDWMTWYKFKPQPQRVSTAKVRALIRKQWDPLTWGGDGWKNPNEVEGIEPPDTDELFYLRK